jgi:hypothetical protein
MIGTVLGWLFLFAVLYALAKSDPGSDRDDKY